MRGADNVDAPDIEAAFEPWLTVVVCIEEVNMLL